MIATQPQRLVQSKLLLPAIASFYSCVAMPSSNPHPSKRLKFEPLEDRRLLAVFTVSNLSDGPVATAGDLPGSLRQAIFDANALPGDDEIQFTVTGEILLNSGELEITDGLTINGPGQEWLTIDAQRDSRIFNITSSSGDYLIQGLTLTGGETTLGNGTFPVPETTHSGGAIRSVTDGELVIANSKLTDNKTSGSNAHGGAVFSGPGRLSIIKSTLSNNSTDRANGSAIFSGELIEDGNDGFIAVGSLEIEASTISNNFAGFSSQSGAAIFSRGDMRLDSSAVSGNVSFGSFGAGGGIAATASVEVHHSTITDNHVRRGAIGRGGGIYAVGIDPSDSTNISHSIIARNSAIGLGNDLYVRENSVTTINHSLIGDTTGSGIDATTGTGNLLNIDPLLGPLADNGGPTQTHALLPGSPAIDAGDIGIVDPPLYDQRGAPFNRIVDGNVPADVVIDIGAYEAQGVPSADFNTDNALDGFDFLTWQRGFGMANATQADGDSDFDADVDASDLAAWQLTYGQGTSSSVQALTAESSFPDPALAIAAALVDEVFEDEELLALPEQNLTVLFLPSVGISSTSVDDASPDSERPLSRTSATRDGGELDPLEIKWQTIRRQGMK